MTIKASALKESTDIPNVDDNPEKTHRAATESMTIHPAGDALWDVYSGEHSHYEVFGYNGLTHWQCTCPDHENRHCECKHIRRVQMELGLREIPETPEHFRPDVEVMAGSRVRVHKSRIQLRGDV